MTPMAQQVRRLLRPNAGWWVLLAALLLTWMGIFAIDTVDLVRAAAQGQRWLPIALLVMFICVIPHPRQIGLVTYPLMALSLFSLVYLMIPGAPLVKTVRSATSWLNIPGVMSIQPSEIAKVVFILALARYLRFRENYRTFGGMLVPFLIMLIPVGLILKQPDLGTALLFAPTLFVVLVAAGAKLRHLGALLGLALAAVVINVAVIYTLPDSLQLLQPHQRKRIISMISLSQGDTRYNQNEAYHQVKAMTLIGAGGMAGYGEDRASVLLKIHNLPEAYNDTIFAVVVMRWGLVGAGAMLGIYLLLVSSMLLVASRNKDPFIRLSCVGFAAIIFVQEAINIAMFLGLLPITGITLPLVSYGGSSLVVSFAMVGLTINFASRRPARLIRPSFEFDNPDAIYQ
jgi:rod shape determining protein RodA